jgi:hypothetical protein
MDINSENATKYNFVVPIATHFFLPRQKQDKGFLAELSQNRFPNFRVMFGAVVTVVPIEDFSILFQFSLEKGSVDQPWRPKKQQSCPRR